MDGVILIFFLRLPQRYTWKPFVQRKPTRNGGEIETTRNVGDIEPAGGEIFCFSVVFTST